MSDLSRWARLGRSPLIAAIGMVVALHVFALVAQLAMILLIPSWAPSSAAQRFPFNIVDWILGAILFPYMLFRREMSYSIPWIFGAEVYLAYCVMQVIKLLKHYFRNSR